MLRHRLPRALQRSGRIGGPGLAGAVVAAAHARSRAALRGSRQTRDGNRLSTRPGGGRAAGLAVVGSGAGLPASRRSGISRVHSGNGCLSAVEIAARAAAPVAHETSRAHAPATAGSAGAGTSILLGSR